MHFLSNSFEHICNNPFDLCNPANRIPEIPKLLAYYVFLQDIYRLKEKKLHYINDCV